MLTYGPLFEELQDVLGNFLLLLAVCSDDQVYVPPLPARAFLRVFFSKIICKRLDFFVPLQLI